MQITIREAQNCDYDAIGQLIKNELGYSDLDLNKFKQRLNKIDEDKNYTTFVAVNSDNNIVGFIGLCKGMAYELDGGFLKIMALAVSEKFQNRGIGTKLIEQAENFARQKNLLDISLNSGLHRLNAHKFYENRGYIKKGFSFSKKFN